MKNIKSLTSFQTTYNGFLHIGRKQHSPHAIIQEDVYVIESSKLKVTLTQQEAIFLANQILDTYKVKEVL